MEVCEFRMSNINNDLRVFNGLLDFGVDIIMDGLK